MKKAGLFAIVGFVLAGMLFGSRTLRANGEEFFEPAGEGPVALVYFGHIKDSDGKPLDNVVVWIQTSVQVFNISNDSPGHYRSPDVGTYFKETGETLDASNIKILAAKPGYQQGWKDVPKKVDGAIQVDFVLLKDGEIPAVATNSPLKGWPLPLALVALVGLITAAAVRTSGRPQSTDDSSHAAV
jgi:hypothetical protein